MEARYKADIGGGALSVPESRIIAKLLLEGVGGDQWRYYIETENVLQRRSPGSAKRLATLIRGRLRTMDAELWRLVSEGTLRVATHAVFAAALKHSKLLGDFLDLVVREQFRLFRSELPRKLWADYLEECRNRDPLMPTWLESTATKQGDTAYRILAEVGYIESARTYKIRPIRISPEVLSYLQKNEEAYVLRCIQVCL